MNPQDMPTFKSVLVSGAIWSAALAFLAALAALSAGSTARVVELGLLSGLSLTVSLISVRCLMLDRDDEAVGQGGHITVLSAHARPRKSNHSKAA